MKSSATLIGVEFKPPMMVENWNSILEAIRKKPKTLEDIASVVIGIDPRAKQNTIKQMGYCQTDSDPEF